MNGLLGLLGVQGFSRKHDAHISNLFFCMIFENFFKIKEQFNYYGKILHFNQYVGAKFVPP